MTTAKKKPRPKKAANDAPAVKPTAKTVTDRVAAWRARKAESNLAEVRAIYAHPDDHPEIKRVAMKVVRKRERAGRAA
jgi:hypothetical protein